MLIKPPAFSHDLLSAPLPIFCQYLRSRDRLFPFSPELWLRSDGYIPLRSWFMRHFPQILPHSFSGHSLHAGGATALAEHGVPPHIIQALGRWSSDAFQVYIRRHPALLASFLIHNHATSPL